MRSPVLLLLLAVLPACSGPQVSAPERLPLDAVADTDFFLLQSAGDPRLPALAYALDDVAAVDPATLQLGGASPAVTQGMPAADPHPALYWNEVTRQHATAAAQPPPLFARSYALVHIAIYDALHVTERGHGRRMPANAVAAGAAFEVLPYLFPDHAASLEELARAQAQLRPGPALAGWGVGRAVGRLAVEWGRRDGSGTPYMGTPPTGPGIWTGTNPVLPMCGTWRTWMVRCGSEIMPEPPYAFGSAEDLGEVDAVYQASLHRTPEQIAVVHKWGDRPPPVIWNGMLVPRLLAADADDLASARALAYLNAAMYDAFVTCWGCKYTFWIARPFQRIPGLVTVIPTPNFPSYTSGHATISAAAAEVMCELFPGECVFFLAEAAEAAMSRFWGGIHFHHDNEEGLEVGERVGAKAVACMRRDGLACPIPRLARHGGGRPVAD